MTGTITSVDAALSSQFTNGETVSLTIWFDDASADTTPVFESNNVRSYDGAITGISGIFGSYSFALDGTSSINQVQTANSTFRSAFGDHLTFSAGLTGGGIGSYDLSDVSTTVTDPTDAVWTQLATGTPPFLSDISDYALFTQASGLLDFIDPNTDDLAFVRFSLDNVSISEEVVPEPASMTLLGLGLGAMAYRARRRRG